MTSILYESVQTKTTAIRKMPMRLTVEPMSVRLRETRVRFDSVVVDLINACRIRLVPKTDDLNI